MTSLQEDLLEIYNNLTEFSSPTLLSTKPKPIKVMFDKETASFPLIFTQGGKTVRLGITTYYCRGLEKLYKNPTYLLPKDYDTLMYTLQQTIYNQAVLDEKTCLSPEEYGFDIYAVNAKEFIKGPQVIGRIRFVSGDSWIFKLITKLKYRV